MYKAYKEHIAKHGQKKAQHTYKLWYFAMKGRAETIRLIFAHAGVEYDDHRFAREDWPQLKSTMPQGTVPVLEVDGYKLGQSGSICRYLATEFGLAGDNEFEAAIVDSIGEVVTEIRENFAPAFMEQDEQKKLEMIKIYTEQTLPAILQKLDSALGENQFLFGDKVTWTDLHFYGCVESFPAIGLNLIDIFVDFPNLLALVNRVKELPNIANWIENRPTTMF